LFFFFNKSNTHTKGPLNVISSSLNTQQQQTSSPSPKNIHPHSNMTINLFPSFISNFFSTIISKTPFNNNNNKGTRFNDFLTTWKRFIPYILRFRWTFLACCVFTVLRSVTLASVGGFYGRFVQKGIDKDLKV